MRSTFDPDEEEEELSKPLEVPEDLQNFNEGKLSDDEDNSWNDAISETERHFDQNGVEVNSQGEPVIDLPELEVDDPSDDDYYGEQDDDYGIDDEYGDQWAKKRKRASKHASKYHNLEKFFNDRRNHKRVIMNVYCTEYDVVKKSARKVARFKNIEVIENPDGGTKKRGGKLSPVWDVSWHDLAITPDFLAKMEPYQKVS